MHTLGFGLHILWQRMLKEEGFLSDKISKLKPSKSERWLPPPEFYKRLERTEMKQHPILFPLLLRNHPNLSSPFREGIRVCLAGLFEGSFYSSLEYLRAPPKAE